MSTVFKQVNFDTLFHNSQQEKFLINELDVFNTENKKIIDSYIFRNFDEDNISIIPSCVCGNIKGTYYVGDKCSVCNTHVRNSVEDEISFFLWAKRPEGVEKFISPIILAIMNDRYKLTKPTVPIIQWLLLPHFRIDRRQAKNKLGELERLSAIFESMNIKRGYNSFVQNLIPIIEVLEEELIKKRKIQEVNFLDYIIQNKDTLLSEYIPFPNRTIFTTESNELGRFVDKNIIPCVNVIRRLTGIDLSFKPNTVKQNKVASSLIELSEFYKKYMKDTFFAKPGLIRQHISSTRSHFTMRCVATSIYGSHHYREVYLPWSASCSMFQEHILNKLMSRGMIYKEALKYLNYHNRIYSPVLDEIFQELIREASGSAQDGVGIPIFLNRNPSLHRGSMLSMVASKIKTDPEDNTISVSLLIVRSLNLDFDGDEINITLIYDEEIAKQASNFEPHLNILGLEDVDAFTDTIALPKTIVNTISNWFKDGQ